MPVEVVVPAYDQAVNAGRDAYTDLGGDSRSADQASTAGSWGDTAHSSRDADTRSDIAGTDDDALYQSLRQDPIEYRFDGLPSGVAELGHRQPNRRLFDVIVEGDIVLSAHDIAGEVGTLAADQHVFFVPVIGGQLNVRFVARRGYAQPIVNAIQVIHRPDQ